MPTVAIREGMNHYQPMVKSNRYLGWGISASLAPKKNVVTKHSEALTNLLPWNPKVLFAGPVLSRPFPGLVKHPEMQLADIVVGNQFRKGCFGSRSPFPGQQNVVSLPFI